MRESPSQQNSATAALVVWSSVCLSVLRLSLETANRLILWHLYGYETVVRHHLTIVRVKPELVVSNGDVLKGWGFTHYLIGVSLWIPISTITLVLLFKYLAPDWWKRRLNGSRAARPGGLGIAALLVMFFCIPGFLPFAAAMAMGLTGTAVGLYWLRATAP